MNVAEFGDINVGVADELKLNNVLLFGVLNELDVLLVEKELPLPNMVVLFAANVGVCAGVLETTVSFSLTLIVVDGVLNT